MVVLALGENTAWLDGFVLLDGKPIVKVVFDLSDCPEEGREAILKIIQQRVKPIKVVSGEFVSPRESYRKWVSGEEGVFVIAGGKDARKSRLRRTLRQDGLRQHDDGPAERE